MEKQEYIKNWQKYKGDLFFTVSYYYVTYTFQSDSTLYSCLNMKKLHARNRRYIWSISYSNRIRTHNHLARKRALNHLAKLTK